MLEAPEVEAHRHKTGHSHLDLILGGLAVFLSMVSVFIAVQHGKTMERLVAANSWPNISYGTGNEGDKGEKLITLQLKNTGVGPARIDSFELFYKDKPYSDVGSLMKDCCIAKPGVVSNNSTSLVLNEVLPARDSIEFISLAPQNNLPEIWNALDKERFKIRVRVCYCSVFDECWVRNSNVSRPAPVSQCAPSQPVQFDEAWRVAHAPAAPAAK
jgi:hypothetical protein